MYLWLRLHVTLKFVFSTSHESHDSGAENASSEKLTQKYLNWHKWEPKLVNLQALSREFIGMHNWRLITFNLRKEKKVKTLSDANVPFYRIQVYSG